MYMKIKMNHTEKEGHNLSCGFLSVAKIYKHRHVYACTYVHKLFPTKVTYTEDEGHNWS